MNSSQGALLVGHPNTNENDTRIKRMKNLLLEAKRKIEGPIEDQAISSRSENAAHLMVKSETERLKSQRQSLSVAPPTSADIKPRRSSSKKERKGAEDDPKIVD